MRAAGEPGAQDTSADQGRRCLQQITSFAKDLAQGHIFCLQGTAVPPLALGRDATVALMIMHPTAYAPTRLCRLEGGRWVFHALGRQCAPSHPGDTQSVLVGMAASKVLAHVFAGRLAPVPTCALCF